MKAKGIDFLAVVSPGAASIARPAATDPALVRTLIPGVALGIAGVATWKAHPVLGFLAGDAIGLNGYRYYRNQGNDRTLAMCNIGSSAAAIAGSLLWKEHPFWGWCVGFVAGAAMTSLVPGSNAYKLVHGANE